MIVNGDEIHFKNIPVRFKRQWFWNVAQRGYVTKVLVSVIREFEFNFAFSQIKTALYSYEEGIK